MSGLTLLKCAIIPVGSAPLPLSSHFHDIPYIRHHAAERILGVFLSPSGSTSFKWDGLVVKLEFRVKKWVPIFLYQARFHPPPANVWRQITFLLENFVSANKVVLTHAVQRLWSRDLIYASVKDGGLGVVDPAVRLQALSLQRIAHLFRFKNDAASFSISTLHLPFHTRTFTSHCDVLRHDFPLSFRWKSDLSAFFSSLSVIAEPPLHPDCILSEKLAFNRFILRTQTKSFGLLSAERFLIHRTLGSLFIRDGSHWRVKRRSELLCSFSPSQARVLLRLYRCIPASWVSCLSSFFFSPVFCSSFPFAHFSYDRFSCFVKIVPCDSFSFFTLGIVCVLDSLTSLLTVSESPPLSFPTSLLCPVAARGHKYLCHLSDPLAIGLRISFLQNGVQPSHAQLLRLLRPSSRVPYLEKWSSLVPFFIDWPLTIQQRRASFIPHKARDVLLRVHARNIQVAPRLHLSSISPLCSSCPDVEESLFHCFFECPVVSPIIASLVRILTVFFSISISHPAQLLFAFADLPRDGFPFTILSAISFQRLWLNRCDKRYDRSSVSAQALLFLILDDFHIACSRHFSTLQLSQSKKGKKVFDKHVLAASSPPFLLFTSGHFPLLHPQFKGLWLQCERFHPP